MKNKSLKNLKSLLDIWDISQQKRPLRFLYVFVIKNHCVTKSERQHFGVRKFGKTKLSKIWGIIFLEIS